MSSLKTLDPADGNFSVTFQMFNDETAGTVVFAETVASLVVVDGALVYELGTAPNNALDDAELAAGELYLSVIVNGTTLEPRVPIRSVPFAAKAGDAEAVGGVPLAAIQDGAALSDGAITARHISGLTKVYTENIGCIEAGGTLNAFTNSSVCIAPTTGCSAGQQHPCGSLFVNNCVAIVGASRQCANTEIGSLVFAP